MPREYHLVSDPIERGAEVVQVAREGEKNVEVVDAVFNRCTNDRDHGFPRCVLEVFRAQPDGADVEAGSPESTSGHLRVCHATTPRDCFSRCNGIQHLLVSSPSPDRLLPTAFFHPTTANAVHVSVSS